MARISCRKINIFLILLLILPTVLFGQSPGSATASCTLAGSWYGGDPGAGYPYYHGFLTPLPGNGFSAVFQPNFPYGSPYLTVTQWTGEILKKKPQTFEGYLMSMASFDPYADSDLLAGIDPNLPEMDFIHSRMELVDCNTMRNTIDHWYVYYNFTNDIKPLSGESRPPDIVWDIDPPIVEIYHKMPGACPGCPFAISAAGAVVATEKGTSRGHANK